MAAILIDAQYFRDGYTKPTQIYVYILQPPHLAYPIHDLSLDLLLQNQVSKKRIGGGNGAK